jgi:hypothetical protein
MLRWLRRQALALLLALRAYWIRPSSEAFLDYAPTSSSCDGIVYIKVGVLRLSSILSQQD